MIKNQETIITKGIPLIISMLLGIVCFNALRQFISPEPIDFPPPSYLFLIEALILTVVIVMSLATLWGNRWGYQTIKWLLIISSLISLYLLWTFITRLWDYKSVEYIGNGLSKNIPLTFQEKWTDIYKPILCCLIVSSLILIGLWLWTREMIKSKFRKTADNR